MTGTEYANLIAKYLVATYGDRDLSVYREVSLGKTIIGKNRRVDILVVHEPTQKALGIECKYQGSQGTTDEKIPYTLQDLEAMWIPGCATYAGDGFSQGILHMLEASRRAAYCLPDASNPVPSSDTRELDHVLAATFGWWDVVLEGKKTVAQEDG
jgi:hypothetical protein